MNKSETNNFTVQQILSWAYQELQQYSDTAKLDAKILFRHVSDYSDVDLILNADQVIEVQVIDDYQEIIYKRQNGEPIAYLTGQKEFWSLNFKVTPDTLIPRPETELLVETALNLIPANSDFYIADLGTGSGAIACAIANERPLLNITATDKSKGALKVAKENARALNIANIDFVQSDWFENLTDQQFDIIVSNPPYVPAEDENLSRGDVRYEPDLALTPGSDGLIDLKRIIKQAKYYLKPDGYLLVEHGYNQKQTVRRLFEDTLKYEKNVIPTDAGIQKSYSQPVYKNIVCLRDLNGQPRVTYGQAI